MEERLHVGEFAAAARVAIGSAEAAVAADRAHNEETFDDDLAETDAAYSGVPRISSAEEIPDKLYFKIGEASRLLGVKPHVLRYWETEFRVVRPSKTTSRQRLYSRRDVETLLTIRHLLYDEEYTIAGAKKKLRAVMSKQVEMEFRAREERREISAIARDLEAHVAALYALSK
ncbi:MAG: MerR family transcriptional regulator [Deltaproteobacteria bacterium]|nr:MerR family transcriptional regulator [Deltaproteobacteria bacterium]